MKRIWQRDEVIPTRVILVYATNDGHSFLQPLKITPSIDRRQDWDENISVPIALLDKKDTNQNQSLLDCLLPSPRRSTQTSIQYERKGRITGPTEEQGYSHLLLVFLALYATEADRHLRMNGFKNELTKWSASSRPTKSGRLRGVSNIPYKLNALYKRESTTSKESIEKLLLASRDYEIVSLAIEDPEACGLVFPIDRFESRTDGFDLFLPQGKTQPWLSIYFADTFDQALETVFGSSSIAAYRQSLKKSRIRNIGLAVLTAVSITIAMVSRFSNKTGDEVYYRTQTNVAGVSTYLVATDGNGETLFTRRFAQNISQVLPINLDDHGPEEVVIGLGPRKAPGESDLQPGTTVAFNAQNEELWRSHVSTTKYHTSLGFKTPMGVQHLQTIERKNGERILIAIYNSDTYHPCIVRGFSLNGSRIFEFTHPGRLYNCHSFGTDDVCFMGHLNFEGWRERDPRIIVEQDQGYASSLLALNLSDISTSFSSDNQLANDTSGASATEPKALWWYSLSITACNMIWHDIKPQVDGSLIIETTCGTLIHVDASGIVKHELSKGPIPKRPDLELVEIE